MWRPLLASEHLALLLDSASLYQGCFNLSILCSPPMAFRSFLIISSCLRVRWIRKATLVFISFTSWSEWLLLHIKWGQVVGNLPVVSHASSIVFPLYKHGHVHSNNLLKSQSLDPHSYLDLFALLLFLSSFLRYFKVVKEAVFNLSL